MEQEQIEAYLDALRREVTDRIAEAAGRGDSAEARRFSGGYTSLDVLGRFLDTGGSGGGAG